MITIVTIKISIFSTYKLIPMRNHMRTPDAATETGTVTIHANIMFLKVKNDE